MVMLEDVTF